jgi:Protein kinase domain
VADPPADEIRLLTEALADRYAIRREVGHGGMATVFLADDLKHHRQVALKVLRPEIGLALGAERFGREVRIAAELSHPHILPLFDSGEVSVADSRLGPAAGRRLYYVMPYVKGESVRQRLAREASLPLNDAIVITRRLRRRSTTPTPAAWSTATSSPRTSWSTKARPCSPTSASPCRPTRRRAGGSRPPVSRSARLTT